MADTEKSEHETKISAKSTQISDRKRFFPTEQIPRLSHTDPLANELIAQEVLCSININNKRVMKVKTNVIWIGVEIFNFLIYLLQLLE